MLADHFGLLSCVPRTLLMFRLLNNVSKIFLIAKRPRIPTERRKIMNLQTIECDTVYAIYAALIFIGSIFTRRSSFFGILLIYVARHDRTRRMFLLLIIIESKLTANDVVSCVTTVCATSFPAVKRFRVLEQKLSCEKLEQMRIHCTIPRLIMTRQYELMMTF